MRVPGRGWARAAAALAAVFVALALPAGTAVAEPPFRLPSPITDQSGVLTGSDVADIERAMNELTSEDNTQLWVVYVGEFTDPAQAQAWTEQTWNQSDLGTNEILMAVATQGRAYHIWVGDNLSLNDSQLQTIAAEDIEPELADGNWAGAAIAAANAYREAIGGSSAVWWWIAGGIVVIGGGGYLLYRRSRRNQQAQQQAGAEPAGAVPVSPSRIAR